MYCTAHIECGSPDIVVTTSFDSCRTDCLYVDVINIQSATVPFTTELDTFIPYLLLV